MDQSSYGLAPVGATDFGADGFPPWDQPSLDEKIPSYYDLMHSPKAGTPSEHIEADFSK